MQSFALAVISFIFSIKVAYFVVMQKAQKNAHFAHSSTFKMEPVSTVVKLEDKIVDFAKALSWKETIAWLVVY